MGHGYECAGGTHVGRMREHNEDAFFMAEDCGICVVADGMGGHERGEVASAAAIKVFSTHFSGKPIPSGSDALAEALVGAAKEANTTILDMSARSGSPGTMGTTVVAAGLADGRVVVAHVGDSRAYLYRKGELRQLTKDHSFVWELYEQGLIAFDEMRTHPRRNVITRALGTAAEVKVDLNEIEHEKGDVVLLCSDGLNGMLTDAEIAGLIAEHPVDLAKASDTLIAAANDAGGTDNVTVVLMR